jgi:hypothetical protein
MSNGNPVEEGNAEPATSLAGSKVAADVGLGTTNNGSGLDDYGEYDELLTSLGRTEDDDQRIAVHEAGHAVCARLLGHPLGGATVDPDPNGKYAGLVWGPRHSVAFGKDDDGDDMPELCDKLRDLMPQDGEPRSDAADVYLHALNRCIELVAVSLPRARFLKANRCLPSVMLNIRSSMRRWSVGRPKPPRGSSVSARPWPRICAALWRSPDRAVHRLTHQAHAGRCRDR